MNGRVWATSDDGTIEYRSLTNEYLPGALAIMSDSFFKHENVCSSIGVTKNPAAVKELEELSLYTARDGCTIVAIDKATNQVAGASFNKLQVKTQSPEEASYFENFASKCRHPESKGVVEFMMKVDSLVNLFDVCNVDCMLEIMFLGTLAAYRGKGIAKKLCEVSIELARKLKAGENVKVSLDGGVTPSLEPVPKAASAIFTTFITQKLGKSLGFSIATEESYSDWDYNGVKYSDCIKDGTKSFTLEYLKL